MTESDVSKPQATLKSLWWGMLAAMILYGGILAWVIANPESVPEPTEPEKFRMMSYAFIAIAAGLLGAIFFLRAQFEKLIREGHFDGVQEMRVPYLQWNLNCWGLAQIVAFLGFALAFMSVNIVYYFAFAAPAVLVMLLLIPRSAAVEERYRRLHRDKLGEEE